MARWEPNAVERLRVAALELYLDPGYDKVTVAEIAARAGVTRRTFFRYFPDKREVLFFGTDRVEALVTDGVLAASDGTPALEAVVAALAPIAQHSDDDPAWAAFVRKRNKVIQGNGELRERELGKHASLAFALASALERRGLATLAAKLAADAGLAAFKAGFDRWIDDPKPRKMGKYIRDAMHDLESIVDGSVTVKKLRRE
jgi:AcrR family transcriptional regulator